MGCTYKTNFRGKQLDWPWGKFHKCCAEIHLTGWDYRLTLGPNQYLLLGVIVFMELVNPLVFSSTMGVATSDITQHLQQLIKALLLSLAI